MRRRVPLLVILPALVAVVMALAASAVRAEDAAAPVPGAASPDAQVVSLLAHASPAVCRVTVENTWGIPVAVTDGFALADGRRIVVPLGPLALPGVAKAKLEFEGGGRAVATQFIAADASLGLAVLVVEGKPPVPAGLALAECMPPLDELGDVAALVRNPEAGLQVVPVRLLKGQLIIRDAPSPADAATPPAPVAPPAPAAPDAALPGAAASAATPAPPAAGAESAATPAETPAPETPAPDAPTAETFLRLDKGASLKAAGKPVLDLRGRVLAVAMDVITRDAPLVAVPAPLLAGILPGAEAQGRDLSALPQTRWPFRLVRLAGAAPTVEAFSQAVVTVRTRFVCPTCGGRGTVTDDGTTPGGVRRPVKSSREQRCPACAGDGAAYEAGQLKLLTDAAEIGSRIVWSADTEERSRVVTRQVALELLRTISSLPARTRQMLVNAAGVSVNSAAAQAPRGVITYAQVRETVSGPDGRYVMLEPWQGGTTVAIRLEDGSSRRSRAGTLTGEPSAGSWLFVMGMATSRFQSDLREGVFVLPLALMPVHRTFQSPR
jgi:hypothetical protein